MENNTQNIVKALEEQVGRLQSLLGSVQQFIPVGSSMHERVTVECGPKDIKFVAGSAPRDEFKDLEAKYYYQKDLLQRTVNVCENVKEVLSNFEMIVPYNSPIQDKLKDAIRSVNDCQESILRNMKASGTKCSAPGSGWYEDE